MLHASKLFHLGHVLLLFDNLKDVLIWFEGLFVVVSVILQHFCFVV